jgi:hypothetical protein
MQKPKAGTGRYYCRECLAKPAISFVFSAMDAGMAVRAERDQVLFGVVAGMAAKLFVVNFKVGHRATRLTPPAIATQHLLSQTLVRNRIQPQARESWAH